jgi:hypothetical protein
MPGGYEFGANFGDDKLLLASRINMQGALTGRANWQPVDNILLRAQTQVQPEGGNTFKVDADYKGGDFSAGAYFFAGGLVGASYLQSLSEGLSLGVEGFYHLLNQKGGGAGDDPADDLELEELGKQRERDEDHAQSDQDLRSTRSPESPVDLVHPDRQDQDLDPIAPVISEKTQHWFETQRSPRAMVCHPQSRSRKDFRNFLI